jgi:hypothetical protein
MALPVQPPQLNVPPHWSLMDPHVAPCAAQVAQHLLATQVSVPAQVPQVWGRQPSKITPHCAPCCPQEVVGVHPASKPASKNAVPHTHATPPPPHVCGLVQLPQLRTPPH